MQRFLLIALILAFACLSGAWAAPRSRQSDVSSPVGVHRLGPGDELEITLEAQPDKVQLIKVREDGWIYVPPAGEIRAEGLTVSQVRNQLESRLAKTLRHPGVMVGLRSIAARNVVLLGEVNHPGQLPITDSTTLPQLLAQAGGLTANAEDTEAMLVRGQTPIPVPLTLPKANGVRLQAGDVIYIRAAKKIMVSLGGAILTPGVQNLKSGSATIWDAITAAGGPKPEAALSRVQLFKAGAKEPKLLDLSLGPGAPEAATPLEPGDMVRLSEQRVLVVAGSAGGMVPVTGRENLLEVLVKSGVRDRRQLAKVTLIRAQDLKDNRPHVETLDIAGMLKRGDPRGVVTVEDGDVLMLDAIRQPLDPLSILSIFGVIRGLFIY